jgi:hypothetical protein
MQFRDPIDQARYETMKRLKRAAAMGKRKVDVDELNRLLPLPESKPIKPRQYVRRFGYKKRED